MNEGRLKEKNTSHVFSCLSRDRFLKKLKLKYQKIQRFCDMNILIYFIRYAEMAYLQVLRLSRVFLSLSKNARRRIMSLDVKQV